ncbi:multidrug effflux MFS transporter [Oryzibacter oryziterrae]|uniref:multidrug effflux MFS transporter n=1 Tax=Oryzibacter oryziterrae TaxID=2766474 RepID=UPI001F184DB1|nr:multidrug effflux MFS transporter [Oryzibacter oryziterrae]
MHPPRLSERHVVILGSILIALGPISMSLYTPAMPAIATAFGASTSAVKATLTFYFAGFAFAQLVCGPLSDAFGRRPVAIGFLAIYVLGSLGAVLAPSVEILTLARLVQGIGAAAGTSISRAIVRDNFTGEASARVMNTVGIFLAIGPALSPTLGSLMMLVADWHAIFWLMVVYGVALVATVLVFFPETNANPDPARAKPLELARAYGQLITDRRFATPALAMGIGVGGLYALGTMLPFLVIELAHLTPQQFGFGMLAQSLSYIGGGIATKLMMRHMRAQKLVLPGLILCATGGLAMTASALWLTPSYLSVMGPVAIFAFALALFMPDLSTRALAAFPDKAGAAAALMGFIQMGSGFAGSGAAALIGTPLTAFAIVVPAMTIAALGIQLAGRPRD